MEKMDKRLTVPKWVLINWPKIPQILSVQAQKFGILKKRLHWASVVREREQSRKVGVSEQQSACINDFGIDGGTGGQKWSCPARF